MVKKYTCTLKDLKILKGILRNLKQEMDEKATTVF